VVLGAPPLLLIDLSSADTCSLPAARAGVTGRHSATVTGSGALRKDPKNKRQFSNPWRAECSEGSGNGHEKRSGRCRALNATAPIFDNLVWLPRACAPGCVCSKKALRIALFLSDCARQRARSAPRVFTLKDALEVHFRGRAGINSKWQSSQ
jgi:hypothetical protein